MHGCVVVVVVGVAVAKELVDERRAALGGDRIQQQPDAAVYLTYLLSNNNITLDEIYSNVMEMLFAGTDTVSTQLHCSNGGDTQSRNLYKKLVQVNLYKKLDRLTWFLVQDFSCTSFLHRIQHSSIPYKKLECT